MKKVVECRRLYPKREGVTKMGYSLGQLKREVREDLRAARPSPVLVSLIWLVVSFVVIWVLHRVRTDSISDPFAILEQIRFFVGQFDDGVIGGQRLVEKLLGMSGQFVTFFGECFLYGVIIAAARWTFRYGYQGYCLHLMRGRQPGVLRLLCAFPKWGWVLISGFLMEVFVVMYALLILLVGALATAALLFFAADSAWCTALIVGVWVLMAAWMVSILLSYSMTNYILLDEKVDGLDAIGLSKSMMRGRKCHLLVLLASFAGWLLIAALIAGVVSWICSSVSPGSVIPGMDVDAIVGRLHGGIALPDVLVRLFTLPLMVWLCPYLVGAQAKFYDWMKRTDIRNGVWESSRAEQMEEPRQKMKKRRTPPAAVPEKTTEKAAEGLREEAPAESPNEEPSPEPPAEDPVEE